jgi:ABC-type bacteriocin/lantibiotic exporter with double-glycine peptidase domain
MLPVPRIRQPDPVSCLPAAVWCVLQYLGYAAPYEEVADACRMDRLGAVEPLAMAGLLEAGWDIQIVDEFDEEQIRLALENDTPLVATLYLGKLGEDHLAHAVVVYGIEEETLQVMDPLVGEYVSSPRKRIESLFLTGFQAFLISGGFPRSIE